jgi:hypothetical protein
MAISTHPSQKNERAKGLACLKHNGSLLTVHCWRSRDNLGPVMQVTKKRVAHPLEFASDRPPELVKNSVNTARRSRKKPANGMF